MDVEFIFRDDLETLRAEVRLAWAASVWERVECMFSTFVREDLHQSAILQHTWDRIWGAVNNEELNALFRATDTDDPRIEDMYCIDPRSLGRNLLLACVEGEAKHCISAVNDTATLFASHQLFRHGMSPADPGVPDALWEPLRRPVYDRSIELFNQLRDEQVQYLDRTALTQVMPNALLFLQPIDPSVIAQKTLEPPQWEVEYVRSLFKNS